VWQVLLPLSVGQANPPFSGATVIALSLTWTPPPHDTGQPPHSSQRPTTQFFAQTTLPGALTARACNTKHKQTNILSTGRRTCPGEVRSSAPQRRRAQDSLRWAHLLKIVVGLLAIGYWLLLGREAPAGVPLGVGPTGPLAHTYSHISLVGHGQALWQFGLRNRKPQTVSTTDTKVRLSNILKEHIPRI
jgi:hypothetical protein